MAGLSLEPLAGKGVALATPTSTIQVAVRWRLIIAQLIQVRISPRPKAAPRPGRKPLTNAEHQRAVALALELIRIGGRP